MFSKSYKSENVRLLCPSLPSSGVPVLFITYRFISNEKTEVIFSCFSPLFLAFRYRFFGWLCSFNTEIYLKGEIMNVWTMMVALIHIQDCPQESPRSQSPRYIVIVPWCSVWSVLEFEYHSSFWHTLKCLHKQTAYSIYRIWSLPAPLELF